MRRVLFVDGSNLFGGMNDLLQPGEYFEFSDLLREIENNLKIDEVMFYGTYMRVDPLKLPAHAVRAQTQKQFFDGTKAIPKLKFYKGHFSKASGKEKGVDVRLAVDMVVGAATHTYNEAVLMTGDADLTYAVEEVVRHGKPVYIATLGSRFPFGFAPLVRRSFVYDAGGFFVKSIPKGYRIREGKLVVHELKDKVKIFSICDKGK